MTTQYTEFFLGSNSKVAQLETLEISHPNLSATYRVVRNQRNNLIATLEDGITPATFVYYPVRIIERGQREDLEQGLSITFGDLGQILPVELDNIRAASGFGVKPVVKYRTWRSDYLALPLYGPIVLQVKSITNTSEGSTFEVVAPQLNVSKTGEIYRTDRFPMLRGML